jgi:uncharacterized membrane protein
MRRKSFGYFLLVIIVGALIGTVLGEIIAFVIPDGVVKDFFLKSATASLGPGTLNIIVMSFTLGFSIKLNITGVIGILVAAYAFRWID